MAPVAERWSREAARHRWAELSDLVEVPLTTGIACTALWPLCSLLLYWDQYGDHAAAISILAGSVAAPLILCRLARHGLALWVSMASIAWSVVLSVALGVQVEASDGGAAYWMNSWSVAGAIVLVFARPVEEPVLATAAALGTNVAVSHLDLHDLQAWHVAPTTLGAPVPAVTCAIALAMFLRSSVRSTRDVRVALHAVQQQRAVVDALQAQRRDRLAEWTRTAAPLLEDVAAGRRDPLDPELGFECAELARGLRRELTENLNSPFPHLLADEAAALHARGGGLTVNDLGVGHDLGQTDRVRLVGMIRIIGSGDGAGFLTLTLTGLPGHDDAVVVIESDGLPIPEDEGWSDFAASGVITVETPTRWWFDTQVRRSPAVSP